jgi:acyl-CoA thioesterase I
MITTFKGKGVPVMLAGMLAQPNLGAAYAKEFNAIYPTLAKKHSIAFYPFFMDGVATVPGMQIADGMHPSPKGVKVIVGKMLPMVERALDAPAK